MKMEIPIKVEPLFDDISDIQDAIQCCFICKDGQSIFKELLEHFKGTHYEDYNQLPNDSIVQLCSCPDAIQLQFKLLNHILSKSLPKAPTQDNSDLKEEITAIFTSESEPSAIDHVKVELHEDDDSDSRSSASESDYEPQPKRKSPQKVDNSKRRRRKRVEVEVSESFTVKCDYCPRLFTKVQSLQNHYDLMHDPINQFKCSKCEHGHCKTLRNLNSHLRTHEEEEVRATMTGDCSNKICPTCGKEWKTDLQLYHHMLTHREKLLECDHCGMRFNMKNTLWRHILTHFKEKRIKDKSKEKRTLCQYCSMWISFYNLKRHIRTSHSENKHIYNCDFEGCGKSFTESQTLKDHKNLHFGLKPYVCEFCNQAFPHIATLRRHKYRHTDPEKYKCTICSECFTTRKSLTNHVQRQHHDVGNDAKPFACTIDGCNSTFKYENYLQNHMRDVHVKKRSRIRNKDKQHQQEESSGRFYDFSESSV
ncbi:hypothetical protein ACKWTF_014473 [Chironomus riparius]